MEDIRIKWNERYAENEFAYGEEPNHFLAHTLQGLTPGTILFPADGEGRNSTYAAQLGWKTFAFDISDEGQKKALQLASRRKTNVDYQVGEFTEMKYPERSFDVIALIYAHFDGAHKTAYHQQVIRWLKPGGWIILEAFSKSHLKYVTTNPAVGGPRDIEMLYSTDEIRRDFPLLHVQQLTEDVIDLHEGKYHNGQGSVVRFFAQLPV